MTLIIVFTVIGFILGVLVMISDFNLETFFAPLIMAFFACILGFLVAIMIGIFLPVKTIPNDPIMLKNLRNGTGINGSFFLGIGTVDDVNYACYWMKESDGSSTFHKVRLESVKVFEDDPDGPYLQTYTAVFTEDWFNHIGLNIHSSGKPDEFHIPKNSIDTTFQLK